MSHWLMAFHGYVKILNLLNNNHGESVSKGMLLTDEDRALLLKVSNLLEEIIETFEILEDEEAMKSIKEAEVLRRLIIIGLKNVKEPVDLLVI